MVVGIVREVILPQPSKEGNSFIFAGNGILVRDGQWSHISSSTVFGSSSVLSDLQSLTSNFFIRASIFILVMSVFLEKALSSIAATLYVYVLSSKPS